MQIAIPQEQLTNFCERNHIRKLAFFGSVLRDDFRSDSDIDVLVEFEPGYVPGFITMSALEIELSELVERKVDLRTSAELHERFRDKVLAYSETIYEH